MAVVRGELTTVGGSTGFLETKSLLSLAPSHSSWQDILPPMPTGRARPAVVATNTHLVVAGGSTTDVVEALPISLCTPHMALCSEKIYLQQDDNFSSCSLQEMIQSCKPTTPKHDSMWTTIAKAHGTTMVTFGDRLLTIGGQHELLVLFGPPRATAVIHCYNNAANSWNVIGQLPTPRYSALAAVLPSKEVIVVGGRMENWKGTDDVYIGSC